MNEIEIKLDKLAEFYSQKDSIEAQKKALLDEVKVPAEILALQDETNKRIQAIESEIHLHNSVKRKEIYAKLEAMKVPEEVRAIFDAVAKQRADIESELALYEDANRELATASRNKIHAEMQEAISKVYADISQRKADIEIEFSGRYQDVDENIAKLEEEIKEAAKIEKKTVKGQFFMAVYNRGRVSWNTDALDKYANEHPEVAYFRKEGDPSISIRSIK
jgi:hypothetical protein